MLEKLFDGEKVTERTSSFLTSMVTLGNVLGYSPRRSIRSWCSEKFKEYPLEPDEKRILIYQGLKNKKKSPDLDSTSHESISHANVKTLSIIDENLWESARWGGLSFATYSSPFTPPLLAFMFWDGIKAKEIFKRWRERYGENLFQHIKLVILKGINKFEPHWYTMVLVPEISFNEDMKSKQFNIVARCTTMTPNNGLNLDRFLNSYKTAGKYFIIAAKGGEGMGAPEIYDEITFLFKELTVKYAWAVGVNDIERIGVSWEYEPFIPSDVQNAPILEILKNRKEK